jgi:hypothetical protein
MYLPTRVGGIDTEGLRFVPKEVAEEEMFSFPRVWPQEDVYHELALWICTLESVICTYCDVDALTSSYDMRLRRIRHARAGIDKVVADTLSYSESFVLETMEM